MNFLTPENLEKIGIAGLAVSAIIVLYKVFVLFMEQWRNSTDAVNKNTSAFDALSQVFKESSERERMFQKEIMDTLRNGVDVAKDTNERVRELQRRIN